MRVRDWTRRVPWTILVCSVGLMLLGLTGIARGDELTESGDFFSRQLVWVLLAVPVLLASSAVSYRLFRPFAWPMFALSLVLLVAVYFLPARNGSHRWISLGPINLQPSELAKLAYIFTLADYLMYRKNYRRLTGLIVPFLLTFIPVTLILREPDLGTSLVFFPILFSMLFAAGARPRHLAAVCFVGVLCLPALWWGMNAEQKSRVTSLFQQQDGGPAPRGDGYHLHQSKQVLAFGGVWGSEFRGMAMNDPLAYHLPAGRTDFIFCLIGERWGISGTLLLILLYGLLFARGLAIAGATREPFGRLLAVGIVALLAAQTIINTGMTVGLMPITGLTLPLVSYGGSSLLATCAALGLLLNIGLRPGYEISPEPFRFSSNG